jgi:hypothetical protein
VDIEKLIEQYQKASEYWSKNRTNFPDVAASYEAAATALSTLQVENKRLKSLLGEGGQDLWSKENQRADRQEAEN